VKGSKRRHKASALLAKAHLKVKRARLNKDAPTTVTWEIEALPRGVTKATVVHADFQGETATYTGLQGGGWTLILSNMKTLLETGEPMPEGY
jgi:hypothetical protein